MRGKPSAFSRQLSVKTAARLFAVFLCAFGLANATLAASDNCTHNIWKWKIDKNAALELQQSVNEGHQPWRMDDVVAVAAEAIADRKKD